MTSEQLIKKLFYLIAKGEDPSENVRELLRLGREFFKMDSAAYVRLFPSNVEGVHSPPLGNTKIRFEVRDTAEALQNNAPREKLGELLCILPVELGKPVLIPDLQNCDIPNLHQSELRNETGCYIGIPIYLDQVVSGTLCWRDAQPKEHGFPDMPDQFADTIGTWFSQKLQAYIDHRRLLEQKKSLASLVGTATRELDEKNAHLAAILNSSQQFMILILPNGTIVEANKTATMGVKLRHEEFVGMKIWDIPTIIDDFKASLRSREATERASAGETIRFQENLESVNGATLNIDASYTPVKGENGQVDFIVVEGRDITDRLEFERRIQETQKLESLGILAGGIAHDFNNLLTGIIGNANLLEMDMPKLSPYLPYVKSIETAAMKSAKLAKQMLAYSGRGHFFIEELNLNELIDESLHLLDLATSKQAVLKTNLHPELPLIDADASQIRQVMMNLVVNASEAIGRRSGLIAITTGVMFADTSYIRRLRLQTEIEAGQYVTLEVSDNGEGMDKETLQRIFEPFFSTKFTGRGLGLSAVMGIVRGHRGGIQVYSEPSKGTTVKILIPVKQTAALQPTPKSTAVASENRGTVLIIDDDETIRGIAGMMLNRLGFDIIQAEHGIEGLELLNANLDAVCLILLDLTMPKMDGEETFREIRNLHLPPPVVLMSGFSEQDTNDRFAGKGLAGFLAKPITVENLKLVIDKALKVDED